MIHIAPAPGVVLRRRRAAAAVLLGVVLVALLAVVVRLGADVVVPEDVAVPTGTAITVVEPGESLRDVAARVAPGSDAAVVTARIRTANHLSSSLVAPGRPLVVPAVP